MNLYKNAVMFSFFCRDIPLNPVTRTSKTRISRLLELFSIPLQGPDVQRRDNTIHRINRYSVDGVVFVSTCPLDSDLSGGYLYPPFEQLGPGHFLTNLTVDNSTLFRSLLKVRSYNFNLMCTKLKTCRGRHLK